MQYNRIINGIPVCATYSDEEVKGIFMPLLKKLADIRGLKKKRIIVEGVCQELMERGINE